MRNPALLLAVILSVVAPLSAQTFLQEDWTSAQGSQPPSGWSSTTIIKGGTPARWRFDNPGGRVMPAPISGQFAIVDSGWAGPSTNCLSLLRSPPFNASGTTLMTLKFTHQIREKSTDSRVEVYDGNQWNQVYRSRYAHVGYPGPAIIEAIDITAAAGGYSLARVRFRARHQFDWWWAVDDVSITQPPAIDMAVVSIDSPVNATTACSAPLGLQTVTATVQNQGAVPVPAGTLVPVSFAVNGAAPTLEYLFLTANLNAAATASYTFVAAANLPLPGPNNLALTVSLSGDGNAANDSLTQTLLGAGGSLLVTLPYTEDFNSSSVANPTTAPPGWRQDPADAIGPDSDWYFASGNTPTANTGPIGDHGTGMGFYAYVEDSGGNHAQVNLVSPCLDLRQASFPLAQFWLHSFNASQPANENSLAMDVIAYPGGVVNMAIIGPVGHIADPSHAASVWHQQSISLAPFIGQIVELRFRGRSDGGGGDHDLAIDDFQVVNAIASAGLAPRTGLAVFDINGATEANGFGVAVGLNGPYFASVSQGGPMTMSFGGSPNQAIAVLYGPLNPGVATYPGGIGQLDIGGPGLVLGLPPNLAVFVNAIGWAQAGFPGFPIDAMFFTGAAGELIITFQMPNFGIPSATVLTTFQSAITVPSAPFVHFTNAVEVTVY